MRKIDLPNLNIFTTLLEKNLIRKDSVYEALDFLKKNPKMIKMQLDELSEAVSLFNQYHKKFLVKNYSDTLLINTHRTSMLLDKKALPDPVCIINILLDQKGQSKFLHDVFHEINSFHFLKKNFSPEIMSGKIVISLYRTYFLCKHPSLRKKDIQIASTIEEMIAIRYLYGQKSRLFPAIKDWILDFRKEGFSEILANMISQKTL